MSPRFEGRSTSSSAPSRPTTRWSAQLRRPARTTTARPTCATTPRPPVVTIRLGRPPIPFTSEVPFCCWNCYVWQPQFPLQQKGSTLSPPRVARNYCKIRVRATPGEGPGSGRSARSVARTFLTLGRAAACCRRMPEDQRPIVWLWEPSPSRDGTDYVGGRAGLVRLPVIPSPSAVGMERCGGNHAGAIKWTNPMLKSLDSRPGDQGTTYMS